MGGENTAVHTVIYQATDSSDNAARCSFDIKLIRDMTQSEEQQTHKEYHDKIQQTQNIEESEQEFIEKQQGKKQDDEWSEKARRLREEREFQNKQRRATAKKRGSE